jgi:hypothetical protein
MHTLSECRMILTLGKRSRAYIDPKEGEVACGLLSPKELNVISRERSTGAWSAFSEPTFGHG